MPLNLTSSAMLDIMLTLSPHVPGGKLLPLFMSAECDGSFVLQSGSSGSSRGSMGRDAWPLVTNMSLSLFLPFVKEIDELWQAGLSSSDAHKSPGQSTAIFDRDAEAAPRGSGELCGTCQWQIQLIYFIVCKGQFLKGRLWHFSTWNLFSHVFVS